MGIAIRTGAGWRCDCFGDMSSAFAAPDGVGRVQWNHMYDCYPAAVAGCGAQDAWKTAPVD